MADPLTGRFAGRRVLVTGAASGIGAATVVRLAAEGATVACVDVDTAGLSATVAEIGAGAIPPTRSICWPATPWHRW